MTLVIVSGFFNPLHGGHLDVIQAAAKLGDRLVVIVNNDVQQVMKKDKIILPQETAIASSPRCGMLMRLYSRLTKTQQ